MLGSCGAITGRSPAPVVTRSWFAPRTAGARYNLRSGGTTSLTANRGCMTSPPMSKSERDTTMHPSAIAEQATSHEPAVVLPNDEHNQKLVSDVRPPDWVNPDPTGTYNIVVIGAGTAGLVTAGGPGGGSAKRGPYSEKPEWSAFAYSCWLAAGVGHSGVACGRG